jgi:hypothetical protein
MDRSLLVYYSTLVAIYNYGPFRHETAQSANSQEPLLDSQLGQGFDASAVAQSATGRRCIEPIIAKESQVAKLPFREIMS